MVLDRLTRALDQTADAVLIANREGIIEYVNPAFEAMSGFSRDDMIGRTPAMLRSGVQKAHFYDRLWATILSGQTFRAVVTDRRRDGRLFDYDQTITPIRSANGTVTHFVATGRDVTERRRVQSTRIRHHVAHERRQLAARLHSDAGQFLALAHMTIAEVAAEIDPALAGRLNEVRHYLDRVEERLRRAARGVQPRVLSDLGLEEAINFLAAGWTRRTGMKVSVNSAINGSCPATLETMVYRFAQAALTELHEHAGTVNATIGLARDVRGRRTTDEAIVCAVRGDTNAVDPDALARNAAGSPGIEATRKRLATVGGVVDVVTLDEGYLEVRASVPLGT